jgi:hypothetical protein
MKMKMKCVFSEEENKSVMRETIRISNQKIGINIGGISWRKCWRKQIYERNSANQ